MFFIGTYTRINPGQAWGHYSVTGMQYHQLWSSKRGYIRTTVISPSSAQRRWLIGQSLAIESASRTLSKRKAASDQLCVLLYKLREMLNFKCTETNETTVTLGVTNIWKKQNGRASYSSGRPEGSFHPEFQCSPSIQFLFNYRVFINTCVLKFYYSTW